MGTSTQSIQVRGRELRRRSRTAEEKRRISEEAFAPSIRACEQIIFAAQDTCAQGAFRRIVPRAGLCRIRAGTESVLRRISSCSGSGCRHNYRLSRNSTNRSSRAKSVRRKAGWSRMGEGVFLRLHVRRQVGSESSLSTPVLGKER
jgi:hypothetical protein